MKQTENNRNRLSFGLFRFEPKKIFDCFEDTLVYATDTEMCYKSYSIDSDIPTTVGEGWKRFLALEILTDQTQQELQTTNKKTELQT